MCADLMEISIYRFENLSSISNFNERTFQFTELNKRMENMALSASKYDVNAERNEDTHTAKHAKDNFNNIIFSTQ